MNTTDSATRPTLGRALMANPFSLGVFALPIAIIGIAILLLASTSAPDARPFALLLVVIAFGCAGIGWMMVNRVRRMLNSGVMVKANSVNWGPNVVYGQARKMSVTYDFDGVTYSTAFTATDPRTLGKPATVQLLVDPSRPKRCIIASIDPIAG